jgi:hypothetical protein
VSPAAATRFDLALGVVGLALLGATVWTIVLSIRRRWARASSVAAYTFWLAVFVQAVAWFVIPAAVVSTETPAAVEQGASEKARILAESISEGMNCTAPLIVATPAAAVVWAVAAWALRKGRRASS